VFDEKPASFLSFDVEALPGRATSDLVARLVWGKVDGAEFGIRRISKILGMHRLKGNFLVDFSMCLMHGDDEVRRILDFLREEGHEVHCHLHSEWVVRKWGLTGGWEGPLGLDRTSPDLTDSLLQFTAWKFHALTGLEPVVFRSGGYQFSESTIRSAAKAGFRVLSNYNSTRHQRLQLPEPALNNDSFTWDNGVVELPVDFSPDPLSFDWTKYIGGFGRIRRRKTEKTFNLVLHSWSLLRRTGELLDSVAPDHETRLHEICEHLCENTQSYGYAEYLARRPLLPRVEFNAAACSGPHEEPNEKLSSCTICGYAFTGLPGSDTCPGCGSRARHRQLQDVLSRRGNPFDGKTVLANYANRVEVRSFLGGARTLLNFDVRPVSEVELQMDVQDMRPVRSGSIDAFFALHVLNHVKDDGRALAEVARVLKPGGLACVTVPYREQAQTAASENVTEHYGADALEKYGVGTFRRYGLEDARSLFSKYFEVEAEAGYDAVTRETMLIFLLRKHRKATP
jgi:hypothetical protein